jgi:hypothetical protein
MTTPIPYAHPNHMTIPDNLHSPPPPPPTLARARAADLSTPAGRDAVRAFLATNAGRAEAARLRLQNCPTHGQQPTNAWGCPECVRELRAELAEARQEVEYLRRDLDTAREAVRRLVRWNLEAYDSEVTRGVYLWATLNGMAGPLLPLPEWLAKREQLQGDQEARC